MWRRLYRSVVAFEAALVSHALYLNGRLPDHLYSGYMHHVTGHGLHGRTGRKLAYLEFKITITLLILSFEYMDLPPELRGLEATETVFRAPDDVKVRLKVLR